ncbi:MAG: SCO family protein [Phycisphaerales bacterium]|nr:SCO family protein [Phycisphaerales bacterium]
MSDTPTTIQPPVSGADGRPTGPMEQLRQSPLRVTIVALAVVIAALALWRGYLESKANRFAPQAPRPAEHALILGAAPAFDLIERSERHVRTDDFKGQVWIADFIFTRCQGPCPKMTAAMARLQETLKKVPGVVLVSFTVDPEHDRPDVLREYAREHGADPQRWLFLTGTVQQMEDVQVKGFKMGMVGESIHHSDRFVLIDTDGGIRGYFDVDEAGQIETLAAEAAALAKEIGR